MKSTTNRPTNEVVVLLQLLRGLIDKMAAQNKTMNESNQNVAALADAVNTLNQILIRLARLAQGIAGNQIESKAAIAEEDRKSDLLQNLSDNLFGVLGGKRPRKSPRRGKKS